MSDNVQRIFAIGSVAALQVGQTHWTSVEWDKAAIVLTTRTLARTARTTDHIITITKKWQIFS